MEVWFPSVPYKWLLNAIFYVQQFTTSAQFILPTLFWIYFERNRKILQPFWENLTFRSRTHIFVIVSVQVSANQKNDENVFCLQMWVVQCTKLNQGQLAKKDFLSVYLHFLSIQLLQVIPDLYRLPFLSKLRPVPSQSASMNRTEIFIDSTRQNMETAGQSI